METIDERISVNLLNNAPQAFVWHGRTYRIRQIGLHHTMRDGRVLLHVFSVTDGNTGFTLQLNTETLIWRLTDVQSG